MNVFMVWSQIEWRKMVEDYLDMYNVEISKCFGKCWKLLLESEKRLFVEELECFCIRYMQVYFDYKYRLCKKKQLVKQKNSGV